ncbi:hypothetical protein PLESTB_000338700 [Pleodorina starrii]|uniref:Uncharacterized protein n=1 Tax=Pleodorina starrii TaxID=330485 RepID=A0A9W6EYJ6_9CHLO|nr:hypothetical protein PLESTB_000338700 [Pleodorina starrii]GLC73151.1 hypothetical protein PLESTF_001337600 [Pleodorina starrii]
MPIICPPQILYLATAPHLQRHYGLGRLLTVGIMRAAAAAGHEVLLGYATAVLLRLDSAGFWTKAGFIPSSAAAVGGGTSAAAGSSGDDLAPTAARKAIQSSQEYATSACPIWVAFLTAPVAVKPQQPQQAGSGGAAGTTLMLPLPTDWPVKS